MPTKDLPDQRVTPCKSETTPGPLSDAENTDYCELKIRKGRSAEERTRLHHYRLRVAAGYAGHDFPPASGDEPEPEPTYTGTHAEEMKEACDQTFTCFPSAPGALVLTGKPVTGERACQMHERLFGRSLPRARSASHGLDAAPTKPRTAARPRHRRDGSRRHSTRGGTSDDPASDSDPPEDSPPPSDGRRFCACGCGLDISHMSAIAKYFNSSHRQAGHRHPDGGGQTADPYLKLSSLDRDALQVQAQEGCCCNGGRVTREGYYRDESYLLDAADGSCAKCGHSRYVGIARYYEVLWTRVHTRSYVRAVSAEFKHDHHATGVAA